MLFVRKTPPTQTVVVEDHTAARAEAEMLAEERGRASGTVAALGVTAVVVLLFLIGYFAWYAPTRAAEANQVVTPTVIHETTTPAPATQNAAPPTTIINNPPVVQTPPTVVTQPPVVRDRIVPVPVPTPPVVIDHTGTNNGSGDTSGNGSGDTSGDNGSSNGNGTTGG